MAAWTTYTLFTLADLAAQEPILMSDFSADDYTALHTKVKADIADKISLNFDTNIVKPLKTLDSTFEILDHIENITVINLASVYWALYRHFFSLRISGGDEDIYAAKCKEYEKYFADAFRAAMVRLEFDEDVTDYIGFTGDIVLSV